MQKVGPKGVNVDGVSDRVSARGIHSEPISLEEGNAMVRDPAAHFNQYRPNVVSGAVKAGAVGAGMGAVVGAVVTLASALWTKGRIDKKDAVDATKNAVKCGAVGGLASSVSFLVGSSMAGTAVTTVLTVRDAVVRSKDRSEAVREAVVGAGTIAATSMGTVSLCAAASLGPAAIVVSPVVVFCSSGWVRAGIDQVYCSMFGTLKKACVVMTKAE